jgi:hypothetical protein
VKNGEHCFFCATHDCDGYKVFHEHFVCFGCKRGFKRRMFDEDPEYKEEWKSSACSSCSQRCVRVSETVRCPRRADTAAWKLLQRLVCNTVAFDRPGADFPDSAQDPVEKDIFKGAKAGTLAAFWRTRGLGGTLHLSDAKRKQLRVPTHNREWEDWVAYMRKTKLCEV